MPSSATTNGASFSVSTGTQSKDGEDRIVGRRGGRRQWKRLRSGLRQQSHPEVRQHWHLPLEMGSRWQQQRTVRLPTGVAIDGSGNVYVVDSDNNRIQKFTGTGSFVTKWGVSGSGDGQFNSPSGIALDASGNVFVADSYNHRIQKFSNTGGFLAACGTFGAGNGQFNEPWGVAADGGGNVYIADTFNSRIQKFAFQ
jgi:sugar lactone lactonase YvrE